MLKRMLYTLVCLLATCGVSAQNDTGVSGDDINGRDIWVIQYQINGFSNAKKNGSYGIGWFDTSFYHWDKLHVGANFLISTNAGIADDSAIIFDFGPSARMDITDRIFVNMPVDVTAVAARKTTWGMRISPSIHTPIIGRVRFYVGPQIGFTFLKKTKPSFGMQVGIGYAI